METPITTFERKPSYIIELEKVYNKYLSWDKSNFKYGFVLSYVDNVVGIRNPTTRKFNPTRVAGAEVFKQIYIDCLNTTNPSGISIEEFNGTNKHCKPISSVPIFIRIIADATMPDTRVAVTRNQELSEAEIANKQMMGGIMGIMGIDVEDTGQNSQIGMILQVQQQMFQKDNSINALNAELLRLKQELSRSQYDSDSIIAKIKDEHSDAITTISELEEEALEYEERIAELEEQIALLESDNEKHIKNGSLQKMGIGALTQIAFGIVKSSPKIQSSLGLLPEHLDGLGSMLGGLMGVEEQPQQIASAPLRVIEPDVIEEKITPYEEERRRIISMFTNELTTKWLDTNHILRLLEISSLLFGNEPVQVHLINALKTATENNPQNIEKSDANSAEVTNATHQQPPVEVSDVLIDADDDTDAEDSE